jgi:hypothetical protein
MRGEEAWQKLTGSPSSPLCPLLPFTPEEPWEEREERTVHPPNFCTHSTFQTRASLSHGGSLCRCGYDFGESPMASAAGFCPCLHLWSPSAESHHPSGTGGWPLGLTLQWGHSATPTSEGFARRTAVTTIFVLMGFELRASSLLGKCSST